MLSTIKYSWDSINTIPVARNWFFIVLFEIGAVIEKLVNGTNWLLFTSIALCIFYIGKYVDNIQQYNEDSDDLTSDQFNYGMNVCVGFSVMNNFYIFIALEVINILLIAIDVIKCNSIYHTGLMTVAILFQFITFALHYKMLKKFNMEFNPTV